MRLSEWGASAEPATVHRRALHPANPPVSPVGKPETESGPGLRFLCESLAAARFSTPLLLPASVPCA